MHNIAYLLTLFKHYFVYSSLRFLVVFANILGRVNLHGRVDAYIIPLLESIRSIVDCMHARIDEITTVAKFQHIGNSDDGDELSNCRK